MPKPDRGPDARRRSHRAGHLAEAAAVLCLRLKGYRILATRFIVKGGEIDIIARRGTTIAFVEVKHRASIADAMIAIAPAKRHRMALAARVFVSRYQIVGSTLRADAVYCAPWRLPLHVPAAFELRLD